MCVFSHFSADLIKLAKSAEISVVCCHDIGTLIGSISAFVVAKGLASAETQCIICVYIYTYIHILFVLSTLRTLSLEAFLWPLAPFKITQHRRT